MQLASLDGVIGPAEETRIPVTDEGLLRGDGAFEVIRLYGGRPFALEDHLARLRRSCDGLRLEADHAALRGEIDALLQAAGPVEALLRLVVTRGARRIATVEPLPPRQAVVRVATVPYAPNRVLDGLKTLSYAGNMLAGRIAGEQGFDEALLVTPHGRVLEGPTWSFFWVRDGALRTPPLEERILASITRMRVIEECGAAEAVCTLDDLRSAEEAFISSTVREVVPIAAVDDIALPAAPGPVTREAHERLARRIRRELGTRAASPARA
jgi:branched-chain amino acid aminotransferase